MWSLRPFALLFCLGVVEGAMIQDSFVDIRPFDMDYGGGGQLMRIATHTVKFDKPIGIKRRSDNKIFPLDHFNNPSSEVMGSEDFGNLTFSMWQGLSLRFNCSNQELSTRVNRSLYEGEDGDDAFPVDHVFAIPPLKNAMGRFISTFQEAYPLFDEASQWPNDTLKFGQVVAVYFFGDDDKGDDKGSDDGKGYGGGSGSGSGDGGGSRSLVPTKEAWLRGASKRALSHSAPKPPTINPRGWRNTRNRHSRKLLAGGSGGGDQGGPQLEYDEDGNPWFFNIMPALEHCTAEVYDPAGIPTKDVLYEIVDLETGNTVTSRVDHPLVDPACNVGELRNVIPKIDEVIRRFDQAVTQTDFVLGLSTLPLLKLMDGWLGCTQKLEGLVQVAEVNKTLSGTRRCDEVRGTPEWDNDPCCNPVLQFEQCCAPRVLKATAEEIVGTPGLSTCGATGSELVKLEAALNSFSDISNLQSDPYKGCEALREERTSDERMQQMYGFYSECHTVLWDGKTKGGADECSSDDECYSDSCVDQGGGSKTCAPPYYDFDSAFLRCAVDKMDSELLGFFFSALNVTTGDSQDVLDALADEFGHEDCVGLTARDGACVFSTTKAVCESLHTNQDGSWWGGTFSFGSWREEAMYDGLNCQLKHLWVNFWDDNYDTCDEHCQCRNAVNKTLQNNGEDYHDFESKFLHFKARWGWAKVEGGEDDDDDRYEFQKLQDGNQTYCELDTYCNWRGTWESVDENECLNTVGKSEMFCGYSRHGYYEDLTEPSKCYSDQPTNNFTQAECDAAGGYWKEGSRTTPGECGKVCNSNPYDVSLIENNGADCEDHTGHCNMRCFQKCARHYHSTQQMCFDSTITQRDDCSSNEGMRWTDNAANTGGYCHNDHDGELDRCQTRTGGGITTLSCRDLQFDECSPANPALSAQELDMYFTIMQCGQREETECVSRAECEAGGECHDWQYKPTVTNITCRVPNQANEDGHPDASKCRDMDFELIDGTKFQLESWQSSSAWAQMHWNDACIVQGLTEKQCDSIQGASAYTRRAISKAECLAPEKQGCFDNLRNMMTLNSVQDCDSMCDSSVYSTKPIHRWTSGRWIQSKLEDAEWIQRQMVPKNQWKHTVPEDAIRSVLDDAIFSIFAKEYASSLKCEMMPLRTILDVLACTCGDDESLTEDETAYCEDKVNNVQAGQVGDRCIFKEIKEDDSVDDGDSSTTCVITPAGTACLPNGALTTHECVEVTFGLVLTHWWTTTSGGTRSKMHQESRLRAITGRATTVQEDCSAYEVVENAAANVIGQVVGNGMILSGLSGFGSGSETEVCLPLDSDIHICTAKYTTADFALGNADRTPGQILDVHENITFSGSSMCATVRLQGANDMLLYPVVRTANKMPYTPYSGPIVKGHMIFGAYDDIAVFDLIRQSAFREAFVSCYNGATSFGPEDVIITEMCEDSAGSGDCVRLDLLSRSDRHLLHTTGSSGVHVDFEIAIKGPDTQTDVIDLIESAAWLTCFDTTFRNEIGNMDALSISLGVDSVVADTVDRGGGAGWDLAIAETQNCQCNLDWPSLTPYFVDGSAVTGGLGRLMQPGTWEVWMCFEMPGHSECGCSMAGNPMCYVFHEGEERWYPWGRNDQVQLCP